MTKIKNKNFFSVLTFFHMWPVYFYQKDFFKDLSFFEAVNPKRIKSFYKKNIGQEEINKYYFNNLFIPMAGIYKNENLSKILEKINLKGPLSLINEGHFFIKRTMLEDYFYARKDNFNDVKNIVTFNSYIENEIKIKELLIRDAYYHFFVNLFPLEFKKNYRTKGDEYIDYDKIFNKFNESFSFDTDIESQDEKIENFFYLLTDNIADGLSYLIHEGIFGEESFFETGIRFISAGEKKIIVHEKLADCVKEFSKTEQADSLIEFFSESFENLYNFMENEDKIEDLRNLYGEIEYFADSFFEDDEYRNALVIDTDDEELAFGALLFSDLAWLKEEGILRNVPGIFDLSEKTFYFKKFNNYKEMFKYAGKMFKEFSYVFYKGKEHLFLKEYLTKPFNSYFKTCSVKEKALIMDNYLKGGLFLSKLLVRLKDSNAKELFKESFSFYEEEINNTKQTYEYFNKSPIGNLLRVQESLFKGNGAFCSAIGYLREIENEFFNSEDGKQWRDYYVMSNKMFDFIYNNQSLFKLNAEEAGNIYYASDVMLNDFNISNDDYDTLIEFEKLARIELIKKTAFSFDKAFITAVAFSSPALQVRDSFIKKLQKYIRNEKNKNLMESVKSFKEFLENDYTWKNFWNNVLYEEGIVFSLDRNGNLTADIYYDRIFTALENADGSFDPDEETEKKLYGINESYLLSLKNPLEFQESVKKITNVLLESVTPSEKILEKIRKPEKTISSI